MVNAIFLGHISSRRSPDSLIINYLGIDYKPTKITHLIIVIFYIIGVLISQQESIQNFGFNYVL